MCENKKAEGVESMEKLKFTQSKIIEFNKTWIIEKFTNTNYESAIFSIGRSDKLQWRLKLHSFVKDGKWTFHPSLTLLPCNILKILVKYTCYILNANGLKSIFLATQSFDKAVSATEITEYAEQQSSNKLNYYFLLDEVLIGKGLLLNGKLSLLFEIQLSVPWNEFDPTTAFFEDPEPICDLGDNIGSLLKNPQKFSDFTFNVGGQEFLVHKYVLSARSRVFEAMFENEMVEKQKNRVDVTDIEPEVFQEMLLFIYTGKVSNLEEMAEKLLAVAEKYELPRLKLMSERALYAAMTVDNAADMLKLAELYNANYLKKQTADFISGSHLATFLETDGFRSLIESCPTAMADILVAVGQHELFN